MNRQADESSANVLEFHGLLRQRGAAVEGINEECSRYKKACEAGELIASFCVRTKWKPQRWSSTK